MSGKKRSGWGATTGGPKRTHPGVRTQGEATEKLVGFISPREGADGWKDSVLLCALRDRRVGNRVLFVSVYCATLEDMADFFHGLALSLRKDLGPFFSSEGLARLSAHKDPKTFSKAAEDVFFSCEALSRLFSREEFGRTFVQSDLKALASDDKARELFTAEVIQRLFLSERAESLFSKRYGGWEGLPKRRTYGTFGAELKKRFGCFGADKDDAKNAMVLAANTRKFFVDYPNFDREKVVVAIREHAGAINQNIT